MTWLEQGLWGWLTEECCGGGLDCVGLITILMMAALSSSNLVSFHWCPFPGGGGGGGGGGGRLPIHQGHCLPPTLCWLQLVPPLVPSPISSLWQPCVHHHWAVLILSHTHPLTLVFTFTSRSQKVRGKGVAGIWSKLNLPTGSVSSFGIGYFLIFFLHQLSVECCVALGVCFVSVIQVDSCEPLSRAFLSSISNYDYL